MTKKLRNQFTLCSLVLSVVILAGSTAGRVKDKIIYDRSCENEELENCLHNDIPIYGSQIVNVNLDESCSVEAFEQKGIFIRKGDIIIIAGRHYQLAGQVWYESDHQPLDTKIVRIMDQQDLLLDSQPGYQLKTVTLEGLKTGHTQFQMEFWWNFDLLKTVLLDIYVNEQPALMVSKPRNKC
eukprot:403369048